MFSARILIPSENLRLFFVAFVDVMAPGPSAQNEHRPVSEFERLLPTFNKVQDICNRIGVAADIHLPQVVVVGAQVSNKFLI